MLTPQRAPGGAGAANLRSMPLLVLCAFFAVAAHIFCWRIGGMTWSVWLLAAMLGVLVALR